MAPATFPWAMPVIATEDEMAEGRAVEQRNPSMR
jgi:hypothetical protein